jgi:hypothetical protein
MVGDFFLGNPRDSRDPDGWIMFGFNLKYYIVEPNIIGQVLQIHREKYFK